MRTADLLLGARNPVVLANSLGRSDAAVDGLIALADTLAIPVVTGGDGYSFPTQHPLHATEDKDALLGQADVVVAFDVYDLEQLLTRQNWSTRTNEDILRPDAKLVDVSLRHLTVKSWADDHGRLYPTELSVAADVALALPAIASLVQSRSAEANADEIEARRARLSQRRAELREDAVATASRQASEQPVALSTLASELWDVVRQEDWVIGNGDLRGWLDRLWDFDAPYRNRDGRGGAGLGQGLGHAIGVALANREHGRLTIDIQSDGDFLFTPAAIWTAVHHHIPLLIVMYNNRTYGNDLGHQGMMARVRGRPEENKTIGIDIDDPVVDFAAMARSMGAWAEGPIERAEELRPVLERAKEEVVKNGRVALVDVYTQVN
jgi:thiamine pyrophosphate-dependent acetolactate synthase large subunit-like protein